jgi:23S rRNA (guanine745-N1)-methyltransferase
MSPPPATFCPGVLTCPVCGGALGDVGRSLRCPREHTFDRAREGYVHLLPAGHGRSRLTGDTRAMVTARRRFLERGYYEPLSEAINAHGAAHLEAGGSPRRAGGARVAVDVGCGDGYYIGRLARALAAAPDAGHGPLCCYGVDVSREAVRVAAQGWPDVTFLVNDVKHRLCVADGGADLLLNVFAPRSPSEFGRVLRPGGLLLVAIPGGSHLAELRATLPMLGIEDDKPERTAARLAGAFELAGDDALDYPREMPADHILDLLRMTPHHWHLDDDALEGVASLDPVEVTISMRLLRFRRTASE